MKHDSVQPNRLNPTNPLHSTKRKKPRNFPFENPPKLYPIFIHRFNLQPKQSLQIKLIPFDNGTKISQEESHGRHDHHIPYRRRGSHGNRAKISLER